VSDFWFGITMWFLGLVAGYMIGIKLERIRSEHKGAA
jgi:hypothetical protein